MSSAAAASSSSSLVKSNTMLEGPATEDAGEPPNAAMVFLYALLLALVSETPMGVYIGWGGSGANIKDTMLAIMLGILAMVPAQVAQSSVKALAKTTMSYTSHGG